MVGIIHLILFIEEYAINFRILEKLILEILLRMLVEIIKIIEILIILFMWEIIINGPIFCQVDKIKQFIQERPSKIIGYQKWKGTIPSLISIARNKIILGSSKKWFNIENSRSVDAIDWIIKYLVILSDDKGLFLSFIRGIKDKRLISKPIHITIHEGDDSTIKVLEVKIKKKSILFRFLIKKER